MWLAQSIAWPNSRGTLHAAIHTFRAALTLLEIAVGSVCEATDLFVDVVLIEAIVEAHNDGMAGVIKSHVVDPSVARTLAVTGTIRPCRMVQRNFTFWAHRPPWVVVLIGIRAFGTRITSAAGALGVTVGVALAGLTTQGITVRAWSLPSWAFPALGIAGRYHEWWRASQALLSITGIIGTCAFDTLGGSFIWLLARRTRGTLFRVLRICAYFCALGTLRTVLLGHLSSWAILAGCLVSVRLFPEVALFAAGAVPTRILHNATGLETIDALARVRLVRITAPREYPHEYCASTRDTGINVESSEA